MDGSQLAHKWKARPVAEGEWAGWERYDTDPFENLTGPYYCRREADGTVNCAFRAEKRHMNGSGDSIHGGSLVTFADYAIFMIADHVIGEDGSVTAAMNAEFLDGASEGELIECRGEVVRAGGSLVVVRGLVTSGERPLLNFSAIIKKIRRRS